MIRFKFTLAGIAVIAVASLALLAACDDDSTTPGTGGTFTESDLPFNGTRERIEESRGTARDGPSILRRVVGEGYGSADSIWFTFDTSFPDYTIEYVDAPTACGSGLPADVAGTAFLEIRMQPTVAHDEAGVATIVTTDMLFDFPTLLQLTMTCDFEGEVVWVAGLSEEVDFKASVPRGVTFGAPIIVLVNHPGQD